MVRVYVGSSRTPKGGFGNRLWHYVNLRSIASHSKTAYFSINTGDKKRISGIHQPRYLARKVRSFERFETKRLLESGGRDDLALKLSKGINLDLKGPMLGEVFAHFSQGNTSDLINATARKCQRAIREEQGRSVVVLHLRGGDFAEWNPSAVLPDRYYFDAVQSAEISSPTVVYRICTDDFDHPAYESLSRWVSSQQDESPYHQCDQQLECDFAAMLGSSVLISSPSTFSILAGILGRPRIVQSLAWATQRAEKGEKFWQRVLERNLEDYEPFALV